LFLAFHLLFPESIKSTHKRNLFKVVLRWRRRDGPFPRPSVPRIRFCFFALDRGDDDVDQQYDSGDRHQESTDRADIVRQIPSLPFQIGVHAARHAPQTEKMLDEERQMESDEKRPERNLTQLFIELLTEHFRPPVERTGQKSEYDTTYDDVV